MHEKSLVLIKPFNIRSLSLKNINVSSAQYGTFIVPTDTIYCFYHWRARSDFTLTSRTGSIKGNTKCDFEQVQYTCHSLTMCVIDYVNMKLLNFAKNTGLHPMI